MKRLTLIYNDESKFQTSYTGKEIIRTEIEIEAYDKNCGSASCIYIQMSEVGEKQTRTITHSLPKNEAIKLRDMLNEIEF